MHAVVNKLTLGKPIDDELLRELERSFYPQLRDQPGALDMKLVRISDSEVIILAFFATREAMDEISHDIAGPWFAEHVRPYLAGPVERVTGEVIASYA